MKDFYCLGKLEKRLKELNILVTHRFYNESHGKFFYVCEINVNDEYVRKIQQTY